MTDAEKLILLDPANPHDFDKSELDELAAMLKSEVPGVDAVPAFREEEGYGGPLSEVVYVWLLWASFVDAIDPLWKTIEIARTTVEWARARWRRDHDKNGDRARARTIVLCDKHGRVMESVRIDLPAGEPITEENPDPPEVPHGRPPLPGGS
jgi:hypothetical protein